MEIFRVFEDRTEVHVCVCVCLPDDGLLQLRLCVVHHVLQDPPQRDRDGQKHKDASDEPGFTVSADLHADTDRRL